MQSLTRLREAETELRVESHIDKLPVELLSRIFHLVVPRELFSEQGSDNTDLIVDEAQRVSQVCRYWRQIAHSTPELWVDGIRFSAGHKDPMMLDFEQTTAWLKRSHPLPITIYFSWSTGWDTGLGFQGTELFRTLLTTTQRWRHLNWDIPHISPLADLPPGSFEMLERFTLDHAQSLQKPIDVFLSASRLREVQICSRTFVPRPGILDSLQMPWKQLTSLTLGDALGLAECRDTMVQCTNVRTMKICASLWEDSQVPLPSSAVVVLPFLHTLHFHVEGLITTAMDHFFIPLALPALKSFELSLRTHPLIPEITWDAALFSEFQARAPNVENLALNTHAKPVGAENLIALLRLSPAVAELAIDGCHLDDAFIRALEVAENDPHVLAPKLVSLKLHGIGTRPSDDALEAMIRSRWNPTRVSSDTEAPRVASLKKAVVIKGGNGTTQKLETRLQDLVQQGLDLVFD
ncbi:hypothetical protein DFH08DRAFT_832269 [Mycena albidolilacea]|uniref:F-box domain-containing protein n=1 Tax=Mycena albidolilacea TaxID=1033008 RepID=A0AAD7AVX5_9AGAR|nr:hypothetical protein DFH08DRAFT_832269 [Mycena albidolilacea]